MGKIKKGFILKFNITFILLGIIFFLIHPSVFAYTDTEVKGGISHYPLIQGEKIELIFALSGYIEPVFKVEIIDDKGNKRALTDNYEAFLKEDNVYKLKFEEEYTLNDEYIKVYIREKKDSRKVDDYELNLKVHINIGVKEDNVYNLDNQRRGDINNVYDKNGRIEDKELISEGLLDYILDEDNLIGDNMKIKPREGELYKLHVYHVESDSWATDNEGYRNNVEWKPQQGGTYFLVLWIKDNGSDKQLDRWVMIPINIINSQENAKIDYIIPSHNPIIYKDKLKFYIKASGSDSFQYKAWVYTEDEEYIEITDGYSEFIDENEVFELEIDENIGVGEQLLWIWARSLGEDGEFTISGGKKFTIQANPKKPDEYFDSSIIKEKKVYKTGEEVIIEGIELLEHLDIFDIDYMYRLRVLDVNRKTWVDVNEVYQDTIKWIPEEEGVYLLYLNAIDKDEIELKNTIQEINEAGMRAEPIVVKDEIGNSETPPKYSLVRIFEELYLSVGKGYQLYIDDDKIEKAYMKAVEVIEENIDESMTDLEKLIIINDYIVKNAEYNTDIFTEQGIPGDSDSYHTYGLLIDNLAVCQGYAEGMKLFLDILGIPNRVITGEAVMDNGIRLSHIWNVVKIDGKEYHLDPTWNDPIPDKKNKTSYAYFLVDDSVIDGNHIWDKDKYGSLNNNEYSYFNKMICPMRDGEWIYYMNGEDNWRLYKTKIDGTENIKLTNEIIVEFLVDDDWIFFSSLYGGQIYRVNKDGLGLIRINKEASTELRSEDEWIIYKNIFDGRYYRVKKDGSMKLPYEG